MQPAHMVREPFALDLRPGPTRLSIDAERLGAAVDIHLAATLAGLDRVTAFLRQADPRIAANARITVALDGSAPTGCFYPLAMAVEPAGYLAIAVEYGERPRLVLRKCGELPEDERGCVFTCEGREFSLAYPSARDVQRRFPVHLKQFYEMALLRRMAGIGAPGLLVDVGANIGNHAVYVAKALGRSVAAFEPCPRILPSLRLNIAANDLFQHVALFAMAAGSAEGRARLAAYDPTNSGATRIAAAADGEMEVVTLDSMMPRFAGPVAILKIDVEGMEGDVISGAERLIAAHRPIIFAEALDEAAGVALRRRLEPLGYRFVASHCETPMHEFAPAA